MLALYLSQKGALSDLGSILSIRVKLTRLERASPALETSKEMQMRIEKPLMPHSHSYIFMS